MPTLPARHRPVGAHADAQAKANRERERHASRPSAKDRGYDRDWWIARRAFVAANPTCSVEGCGKRTSDVDHVISIIERPDLRLDPANFRAFCHSHHSRRTAKEQSFNNESTGKQGSTHPEWLLPSLIPLTLVCGAPAAGKTTYVHRHAGPKDMVLDASDIAAKVSGFPLYEAPESFRDAALRWRNSRLALLSFVSSRWPAAWLVLSEPHAKWRRWWRTRLGARVVVIETPLPDCLEHIEQDPRRSAIVRVRHAELAAWWWEAYERDDDDLIILADGRATTGRSSRALRVGGRSA